ncbi:MAG: hypothetical protein AB4368_17465 [Xenococcaceae cyanobacterium]
MWVLSIPSEKIDRVLKGVSDQRSWHAKRDRAIDPTVWEAQIRSDGMAAWVNDWVIQDCTAITRIGSNKSEWSSETEYDGSRSSLYGSYTLYCQQTNRSAKSPQNFSAELIELCSRILGWQVEKDRLKMAGQTVRVIKGLRLRTLFDGDRLTVEEILEENNQGDNQGDNCGDSLGDNSKPLPNIETALLDNQGQINKEEKNQFLSSNKNQTVQKQINWQSYPYNSSSDRSKKERADRVKAKILGCSTSNELIELKISEKEIDWLKKNLLNQAEREQIKQIELTRQGNLLSVDSSQEIVYFDFNEAMGEIDKEMRRLNWSRGDGKDYLLKTYGVKSRHKLTDGQLIEFLNYLRRK